MKVTTQLTVVIVSGIVGLIGLVVGLAVLAHWSEGAIIAMVTAFGAVFVNAYMTVRNQAKTAQVLEGQDVKLKTIVEQTNGLSDRERQDIANRSVATIMARLQSEGHLVAADDAPTGEIRRG